MHVSPTGHRLGIDWRKQAAAHGQSDLHPRAHPSGPTPSSIIKLNALKKILDAPGVDNFGSAWLGCREIAFQSLAQLAQ